MEERKRRYRTNARKVTIKTTDGSTFMGKINLGIHERASDLFTKTESPYLILFDVEIKEGSGKVYFINKTQIVWAEPDPEDAR